MKEKSIVIANKLLNLYRQAHVIKGKWKAVNQIFLKEATEEILDEISKLPTGDKLKQHTENLINKKTNIDTIEKELIPYNALMEENVNNININDTDLDILIKLINNFQPTKECLDEIINLKFIQDLGTNWIFDIKIVLDNRYDLLDKWEEVKKTYFAYNYWNKATSLLSKKELTEQDKGNIQADMLEYETYLSLFGDTGNDLLLKLRQLIM